jgi:hypothetical protein
MGHTQERSKCQQNLDGESDKDTISGTLVIDGNIRQWILQETEQEGVDWIHLAQDRDQWQGLAHVIMKN